MSDLPDPEEGQTESEWRQGILRGYMMYGLLFAQLQFRPFGTPYHPAINAKPAVVAEWLRAIADDVEGLGKEKS